MRQAIESCNLRLRRNIFTADESEGREAKQTHVPVHRFPKVNHGVSQVPLSLLVKYFPDEKLLPDMTFRSGLRGRSEAVPEGFSFKPLELLPHGFEGPSSLNVHDVLGPVEVMKVHRCVAHHLVQGILVQSLIQEFLELLASSHFSLWQEG